MENSEFEKQLIKNLESFTLFVDFQIKDINKEKFNKEKFCFMYGASCSLRDLAVHLKIDVSFYENYFSTFKEFAESHNIFYPFELPDNID